MLGLNYLSRDDLDPLDPGVAAEIRNLRKQNEELRRKDKCSERRFSAPAEEESEAAGAQGRAGNESAAFEQWRLQPPTARRSDVPQPHVPEPRQLFLLLPLHHGTCFLNESKQFRLHHRFWPLKKTLCFCKR